MPIVSHRSALGRYPVEIQTAPLPFAVAAGLYDHGGGPIEFIGEREREASFQDVLRFFAGSKSIFTI